MVVQFMLQMQKKAHNMHCRVMKSQCGETAGPCSLCFKQGLSSSHCHHVLSHCSPCMYSLRSHWIRKEGATLLYRVKIGKIHNTKDN